MFKSMAEYFLKATCYTVSCANQKSILTTVYKRVKVSF